MSLKLNVAASVLMCAFFETSARSGDVADFVGAQRMVAEPGGSGAPNVRQFQFLAEPILVPSFEDLSIAPAGGWNNFLTIPRTGPIFDPTSSKVADAYSSLLGQIEFGFPLLSDAEKEALKNAQKLLYDSPDSQKPSKAFAAYKKKLSELGEWQKKEQDQSIGAAERNIAAQRVQELSEQLAAWPNAQGLTAAEDLFSRFSTQPSEGVIEGVKKDTEVMFSNAWSEFLRQIEDPSGWTSVSSSGKVKFPESIEPLSPRVTAVRSFSPDGKMVVLAEPQIAAWQFSHKMIRFSWGEFPAQLAGRSDWRLLNSKSISTGKLQDLNTTNSLLPQTCSAVWVVRNVSIWFEGESARELLGALGKQQPVQIGTLMFLPKNTFYTRRSVHCSQPIITAAEIKAYPLLPTPNPKIQWKK